VCHNPRADARALLGTPAACRAHAAAMEASLPSFYRTLDPIDNLVVRASLTLRQPAAPGRNAPSAAPASGAAPATGGLSLLQAAGGSAGAAGTGVGAAAALAGAHAAGAPSSSSSSAAPAADDGAERVLQVAWQQKVFGPR
jgi:hypothetical protein